MKGSDTNKNTKYVSRCIEIQNKQNENYNSDKHFITIKIYKFITKLYSMQSSLLE